MGTKEKPGTALAFHLQPLVCSRSGLCAALGSPASEETTTIIAVMNVLGPFDVILSHVINTLNN